MKYRIEKDGLGKRKIPENALYGSNTSRALENFPFSGKTLASEPSYVFALAGIKKSAALANKSLGVLDSEKCNAIVQACDQIATGKLNEHLVVPLLEGSGGTSINMNVNEVICNRALQIMGKSAGDYDSLHPNDHVNTGCSTNDVIPSAIKIACFLNMDKLLKNVLLLVNSLKNKQEEFSKVFRLGRTCLQDAQPMTLGQAFGGYASVIERCYKNLETQKLKLLCVPLGGTAIGTGLGSTLGFKAAVYEQLNKHFALNLQASKNSFDGMQNLDDAQRLSGELEVLSGAMSKIAKDFIILSSGPNGGIAEIKLPSVQPGSSIMPGKVNPVIPMSVVQVHQLVHGNHTSISLAVCDGLLEINHYEMLIAARLFESIHLISEVSLSFVQLCINNIEADPKRSMNNLMNSFALATSLVPKLGYAKVCSLVKESKQKNGTFLETVIDSGYINSHEVQMCLEQAINSHSL
jgi:aspartate ammonia-lyase